MFRELMHGLMGQSANNSLTTGAIQRVTQSQLSSHIAQSQNSTNKIIFNSIIQVQQVANGYVVNIGTREGYLCDSYIAATIAEVNEIIASAIVAFKLEGKA